MFNARYSGFYTGSFSNEYIVPNTPFMPPGDLSAAMEYYCAQDTLDPSKCAMLAQAVGERIGVLSKTSNAYSGLAVEQAAVKSLSSNKATIAAALYAISNKPLVGVCGGDSQ